MFELLGVIEGLEPNDNEAVPETEIVVLCVIVDDAVCDAVTVPDILEVAVGDTEGVFKELIVDDGVIGGDAVALNDFEGVPLADPSKLRVLVGDVVMVDDKLVVVEPLSLPLGVEDGVNAAVGVPELVLLIVSVAEELKLLVIDAVVESEPVFDELAP